MVSDDNLKDFIIYISIGCINISSKMRIYYVDHVWFFPREDKFSEFKSFTFYMLSLVPNTNGRIFYFNIFKGKGVYNTLQTLTSSVFFQT